MPPDFLALDTAAILIRRSSNSPHCDPNWKHHGDFGQMSKNCGQTVEELARLAKCGLGDLLDSLRLQQLLVGFAQCRSVLHNVPKLGDSLEQLWTLVAHFLLEDVSHLETELRDLLRADSCPSEDFHLPHELLLALVVKRPQEHGLVSEVFDSRTNSGRGWTGRYRQTTPVMCRCWRCSLTAHYQWVSRILVLCDMSELVGHEAATRKAVRVVVASEDNVVADGVRTRRKCTGRRNCAAAGVNPHG
jgi:hypothetical protein